MHELSKHVPNYQLNFYNFYILLKINILNYQHFVQREDWKGIAIKNNK